MSYRTDFNDTSLTRESKTRVKEIHEMFCDVGILKTEVSFYNDKIYN